MHVTTQTEVAIIYLLG